MKRGAFPPRELKIEVSRKTSPSVFSAILTALFFFPSLFAICLTFLHSSLFLFFFFTCIDSICLGLPRSIHGVFPFFFFFGIAYTAYSTLRINLLDYYFPSLTVGIDSWMDRVSIKQRRERERENPAILASRANGSMIQVGLKQHRIILIVVNMRVSGVVASVAALTY